MAIEFITVVDSTGTTRKVAVDLFNIDELAQVVKVAWGADGVVTLAEAAAGAGLPVRALDGEMASIGATTDAAATGNGSVIGLLKQLRTLMSDDGAYYVNGTKLTVKRAIATVGASSTDQVVIAGVSAKVLRVLSASILVGISATTITFNTKPVGASTTISPALTFGANGGINVPYDPLGWIETASGDALTATTSAGSSVGVLLKYVEV